MKNAFVDTNVLVYAAEEKSPTSPKTKIARELLLRPALHLSVQVISEFIASSRNPGKLALTPKQEAEWLQQFFLYPIASLTSDTLLKALEIHGRYQTSHWDSLILATAGECDCDTLYTEDLNHGQDYHGVIAINPFL